MKSAQRDLTTGRLNRPVSASNSREHDANLPGFEPFHGDARDTATDRAAEPTGTVPLSVVRVDTRNHANGISHHTLFYDTNNLVVRRAQEFQIEVNFNRPLNLVSDIFQLEFTIGSSPSPTDGSLNTAAFGRQGGNWAGRVVSQSGSSAMLGITSTPGTVVGRFQMFVAVSVNGGLQRSKRDSSTDVYILFNAWVPDDTAYYPKDSDRNEYVLNDNGVIYQGRADHWNYKPWNYGQFEHGVLDACIFIMDASHMPISDRGNVVKVIRMAAAMLNVQDDNGVLVGNWSSDFRLGQDPTSWTGSAPILQQYASQGLPVRFAQCWVYAGCFNTFLRCLGVASRVITNFNSAHDSTGDLRINFLYNADGTPDIINTVDSIWNYHCWNEAYTGRPDLPPGLGGWQVVDCTPQETSDGFYRCGPSSLMAIKDGHLGNQFDGLFIYAEVRSKVYTYQRDKLGILNMIFMDDSQVGTKIYTKATDSYYPVVVTSNYKYPKGSLEEAAAVGRAEKFAHPTNRSDRQPPLVTATIIVDTVVLGQDLSLKVDLLNKSREAITVKAKVICSLVYYTGIKAVRFKTMPLVATVQPLKTERVELKVLSQEYMSQRGLLHTLHFEVAGRAQQQHLHTTKMVSLELPTLKLTLSGTAKVKSEMFVKMEFTNTLSIPLENVTVSMEGSGMLPYITKHYPRTKTPPTKTKTPPTKTKTPPTEKDPSH
ncbi:coagulation factor XIII A chain-like [Aplochiton taeniatus]